MASQYDRSARELQRALSSSRTGSGANPGFGFAVSRVLLVTAAVVAVIATCVGVGMLTRPKKATASDVGPLVATSSRTSSAVPTPTVTRYQTRVIRVPVPGGTETRTVFVPVQGPGSTTTQTATRTATRTVSAHATPAARRTTAAAHRTAAAPRKTAATRKPAAAQKKNVTHQITGWGCYASNSAFFEDGRFTDNKTPKNGWVYHTSGGGGCNGGFDTMPMSGGWPDNGMDARFQFAVTPGTTTCSAATWVPRGSDIKVAGGNPTGYDFVDSYDLNSGKHLRLAGVDERTHRGRWVSLGTVTTTTGKLMVFEHGNGFDYDSKRTPNWAHHSVTQIQLTCWQ